ncbi:hypothetical protein Dimus_022204, partial [Dionaea muscipula]
IFEEARNCNPLEITRKFANDNSIVTARSVKFIEMKPFQRLFYIIVMKNIVPPFGKRYMASFMDLTYMNYLLTRKKINLPRHMAYLINVPHHELPYGELLTRIFDAFEIPLDDKEGEEPVKTKYFEETFLGMSQLKREDGVWWLGSGTNHRRDDMEEEQNEEEVTPEENELVEEVEAQVEGAQKEKEAEIAGSGSIEEYFDVVDEEKTVDEGITTLAAQPVK